MATDELPSIEIPFEIAVARANRDFEQRVRYVVDRCEKAEAELADLHGRLRDLCDELADWRNNASCQNIARTLASLLPASEPPTEEPVADDEVFCPVCFAGMESSEHHEKCAPEQPVEPEGDR